MQAQTRPGRATEHASILLGPHIPGSLRARRAQVRVCCAPGGSMWFAPTAHAADIDVPVLIAPADLHLRKSDPPKFPSDPTSQAARCLVRVMVGTTGAPEQLDARACPEPYSTLAEDAVRAWRWDPPRSGA